MLRLALFVGGDEDYPNVKADASQIVVYDRCIFRFEKVTLEFLLGRDNGNIVTQVR